MWKPTIRKQVKKKQTVRIQGVWARLAKTNNLYLTDSNRVTRSLYQPIKYFSLFSGIFPPQQKLSVICEYGCCTDLPIYSAVCLFVSKALCSRLKDIMRSLKDMQYAKNVTHQLPKKMRWSCHAKIFNYRKHLETFYTNNILGHFLQSHTTLCTEGKN
jgi:hypothetical protein